MSAERDILAAYSAVGNVLTKNTLIELGIVHRWNQELMFVDNVQLVDMIKHSISSTFAVGPQFPKSAIESCPGVMGKYLLDSTVKPVCLSGKCKLELPELIFRAAAGRDYFPIGVIQGGPEIVYDIAADECSRIYDRFVLFGSKGTLAGCCVCFDDPSERSRFAEKFVKFTDVFGGPINLEQCAVSQSSLLRGQSEKL
jgi:hypothetical protein